MGQTDCAVVWEIVCSDGKVRHPPYHNESDADFDAIFLTANRRRCDCRGGKHTVRAAEPHAEVG